jgi:hypothetical protein
MKVFQMCLLQSAPSVFLIPQVRVKRCKMQLAHTYKHPTFLLKKMLKMKLEQLSRYMG